MCHTRFCANPLNLRHQRAIHASALILLICVISVPYTLRINLCHLPLEPLYTYFAYFLAAFTGGEILIFPIILAVKLRASNIFLAMAVAFVGTLSRDWLLFLLFREKGRQLLLKIPRLKTKIGQAREIIDKNNMFVFLGYRFLFGLVIFIVIVLGLSGMSLRKFAAISLIGNTLFIICIGVFGYFYTEIMLEKIIWVHEHKAYYLLGFVILLGLYLLVKKAGELLVKYL